MPVLGLKNTLEKFHRPEEVVGVGKNPPNQVSWTHRHPNKSGYPWHDPVLKCQRVTFLLDIHFAYPGKSAPTFTIFVIYRG